MSARMDRCSAAHFSTLAGPTRRCSRGLAKHALAGARHVGEDEAEAEAGALVVDSVVVGHDDFGVAKLHDVLGWICARFGWGSLL